MGSLALAAVTLASLTAACGGSTKVSATATTVKGQTAFVSCMEKQGIPASAATRLGGRRSGTGGPGGPGGPGASGSPPAGSGAPGRATPSSLPAGVTQTQVRAGLRACRGLLPAGTGFGGGNRITSPAAAAYRNCLELHGVTLPTPGSRTTTTTAVGSSTTVPPPTAPSSTSTGSAGPGYGGRGLGGLDRSNPTVNAALTACASLRPAPGGATTTTSTTGASS
ncbi:MAG: hypothetical protein ACR2MN_11600 [Acidimicrobiales bacterium]